MKRHISFLYGTVVACLLLLLSGEGVSAQSRFGVVGGITFSNAEKQSLNRSTMNKYHIGVTYQFKFPFGLSIQPALQYHVKGAKLGDVVSSEFVNTCDLTVGYLELPVSVQWGPDLLLFRPFLDISPYIGYALNNRMDVYVAENSSVPGINASYRNIWSGADLRRLEYGVGVGIGLEIWKFQLIGRYNWNFGSLYNEHANLSASDIKLAMMKEAFSKGHNFGGFTLSLSFLF